MSLAEYVKKELPKPEDAEVMIAQAFAYKDCGITTTQLRGIFGHIRRIDAMKDGFQKWLELRLLEPKIHYRIRRFLQSSDGKKAAKEKVENLERELIDSLRQVQESPKKFKRFVEVAETIVAYMPPKLKKEGQGGKKND